MKKVSSAKRVLLFSTSVDTHSKERNGVKPKTLKLELLQEMAKISQNSARLLIG